MRLRLKDSRAKLIVAASERDANLLYATGFFAPDPFILLIHRGRKLLVMSDLEVDRARQQAQVHSILSRSKLERQLQELKEETVDTASVLRLLLSGRKIRSVWVPHDFPLGLAEKLRRNGLRLRVKPDPFFEQRECKRTEEIKQIEKALWAAEAGMQAGLEMIRKSRVHASGVLLWNGSRLTAEAVKQRINATILDRGCIAAHTIVACGEQGCDPHHEGSGPLKANQSIILDIFPRSQSSGYWGDITRTVVKGKASERLKAQFQAVEHAQKVALKQIKAGVRGSDIHQLVQDYFNQSGFETGRRNGRMEGFFHGTGHGVGLEIHEAPRISSRAKDRLRTGHVVTVEPGLYYPGLGGVRLEDLVVVTRSGNRNLTRFPKYLEV
jgi:Xaa-Pro aminopeptidase